jgi:hypothetical protein
MKWEETDWLLKWPGANIGATNTNNSLESDNFDEMAS